MLLFVGFLAACGYMMFAALTALVVGAVVAALIGLYQVVFEEDNEKDKS